MSNHNFTNSVAYKIRKLAYCMDKGAEKALSQTTQINYLQFLILMLLEKYPNSSQKEVAEMVNLTQAGVSKQVDNLVYLKFLDRFQDVNNRRQNHLQITETGLYQLHLAYQVLAGLSQNMLDEVSTQDLALLDKILQKILVSKLSC